MAGLLVGVQLASVVVAVALSTVFARNRSQELLRGTLQLRLDSAAEEVESRATFDAFGTLALPERAGLDLATRFPDPVAILDASGAVLDTFGTWTEAPRLPPEARTALDAGRIAIDQRGDGWALAPLLAPDGLPAGALYLPSLARTVEQETRGTRTALARAVVLTVLLSVLVALVLGAVVTARLVRPLRRMARRVERLGEGDYADRLPDDARRDEVGRLAAAINEMAGRVEASLERLRATDRMRRELVANVGHDLRTPLAALSMSLEEAERLGDEGRDADARAALAGARQEAAAAAALVADLFELSVLERPDATVLRTEPVPLGELLRDVAVRHRRAMERDGLTFEADVPPGLPTVEADGARLVRLLTNLLDNARRHTPSGGTVRLSAAETDHAVTITVADTGEGIAADALPHVFARYYRGQSARTRGVEGTGLGLAIARAVALAHGGTLTAESAPGAGARFVLSLPLTQTTPP